MEIRTIKGHTVIAALDQTAIYQPLPIRHSMMNEGRTVKLETEWMPTHDELYMLMGGGSIIVSILKAASDPSHPPIMLSTIDRDPDANE